MNTIGEIFCTVNNKKQLFHLILSLIWINQLWSGAIPNFINKEININKLNIEVEFEKNQLNEVIIIQMAENKNNNEEIDWIKKYLIIDSLEIEFLLLKRIGIKDAKLISKPIHIENKELEEIEIKIPLIIKIKKLFITKIIYKYFIFMINRKFYFLYKIYIDLFCIKNFDFY